MAARDACPVLGCEELKDKETKDNLCSKHSEEWRESEEFRDAVKDEGVIFMMNLGATKTAMREVAKYRRRWVKRVSSTDPESEEAAP